MKNLNKRNNKYTCKHLSKFLWGCVFALPTLLFFSYYPVIKLGSNESMNFELSLPLIWLVVFDLAAFVAMIIHGKWGINFPGISDRKIFLLSLFPFFATLSIFWSMNPIRAILTAGIIWALFFAVFALIFVLPLLNPPRNLRISMIKAILIPAIVVCVFCWLQCFLDIWGVGREQSLLCPGCVADLFGFPHPSGFAIEPQFMGNLLLAPTLLALYLIVFPQKSLQELQKVPQSGFQKPFPNVSQNTVRAAASTPKQKPLIPKVASQTASVTTPISRFLVWSAAIICSATLFITFSRGAIYAYCVALAIMFIFALAQHKSPRAKVTKVTKTTKVTKVAKAPQASTRPCPSIFVPVITFVFALTMQGVFTILGPTSETFLGGITKSLHHLSLGLIDLRSLTKDEESPAPSPDDIVDSENDTSPIFDGYVAESTNIRLSLNQIAFDTWRSAPGHPESSIWIGFDCPSDGSTCRISARLTPTSMLFGVGLGGAGTAMHAAFPDEIRSTKEIVQNQTFSLLLELGAIGVFLALFALVVAFLAPLLPWWFVDGRAGKPRPHGQHRDQGIIQRTWTKLRENEFWSSPALPLLLALTVAYLVTLNFFSGLPNALQIYLMPPLIFIIYRQNLVKNS